MTLSQVSHGAPSNREEARGRVIFALDVPTVEQAEALVRDLSGSIRFFKVGLELWSRGGRDLAVGLARDGHDVFIDLKLHDIPQTVASATAALADCGARLATLHGPPTAVAAARKVKGERLSLLGVTVLTSMDEPEWRDSWGFGDARSMADVVRARAASLMTSGCDGLVCSPHEVASLRGLHPSAILVTPGVRPAGAELGDQKRVATPGAAIEAGADFLVVGRPIKDAPDRIAAVEAIVDDAWAGFGRRGEAQA